MSNILQSTQVIGEDANDICKIEEQSGMYQVPKFSVERDLSAERVRDITMALRDDGGEVV